MNAAMQRPARHADCVAVTSAGHGLRGRIFGHASVLPFARTQQGEGSSRHNSPRNAGASHEHRIFGIARNMGAQKNGNGGSACSSATTTHANRAAWSAAASTPTILSRTARTRISGSISTTGGHCAFHAIAQHRPSGGAGTGSGAVAPDEIAAQRLSQEVLAL